LGSDVVCPKKSENSKNPDFDFVTRPLRPALHPDELLPSSAVSGPRFGAVLSANRPQ
jgi:hypothetical protein